eukprot:scaffold304_cov17-Prasinocladus_malaysianus.AAC.1
MSSDRPIFCTYTAAFTTSSTIRVPLIGYEYEYRTGTATDTRTRFRTMLVTFHSRYSYDSSRYSYQRTTER